MAIHSATHRSSVETLESSAITLATDRSSATILFSRFHYSIHLRQSRSRLSNPDDLRRQSEQRLEILSEEK